MSSYIRVIYDRLDFIEFKQNLILLKQPQHKASVFYKLTLDDFLKIRDLTLNFENQIKSGARTSISDYESELFEICPLVKTYPSASTLIATEKASLIYIPEEYVLTGLSINSSNSLNSIISSILLSISSFDNPKIEALK